MSFAKGQLVWAKIKGKSWWPSLVSEINSQPNNLEYQVSFVGENLSAPVNADNIADFDSRFKEFSKNKGKKFQDVLKTALEMAKENSSVPAASVDNKHKQIQEEEEDLEGEIEIHIEEAVMTPAPQKRGRGRPRKNSDKEQTVQVESKSRSRTPTVHKDIKEPTHKSQEPARQMVVEEPEVREISCDKKAAAPERMTRSHMKKGATPMVTEPLPQTVRKGRKPTASKERKEDEEEDNKEKSKSIEPVPHEMEILKTVKKSTVQKEKEEKKSVPKQPQSEVIEETSREREPPKTVQKTVHFLETARKTSSKIPLPENFKANNLLLSIKAEPSAVSRIEVTSSKRVTKSILKNPLQPKSAAGVPLLKNTSMTHIKSSAMSQMGTENKRPKYMWFQDVPASVYLTHDKAKHHRNIATDYIVKKVKGSPNFQERMTSIKGTKVKNIQQAEKNWVSKARVAYNSLMIKKFENDLEQLIGRLVKKFKNEYELYDTDEDYGKVFNIIAEFERNKFSGSELISSDIGKLLKTLHRLLINNRDLISNGDMVVSMIAKILHKIKDNIIRYCLDNSSYEETFGMDQGTKKSPGGMEVIEVDKHEIKVEEFSFSKQNKRILDNEVIGIDNNSFMNGMDMYSRDRDRQRNRPRFLEFEHQKALYFSNEDTNMQFQGNPDRKGSDQVVDVHPNFTAL